MFIVLADNQDITRAGLTYLCEKMEEFMGICNPRAVYDKNALIEQLKQHNDAIVVLDYTLFDINDIEELEILHQRFPLVHWILFSDELSLDFVRRVIATAPQFSVVLKESPLQEIRQSISYAARHQRYICQRMTEQLLVPQATEAAAQRQIAAKRTHSRRILPLQAVGYLKHRIRRRDGLRVRLVSALRHDHIDHFLDDLDIRHFNDGLHKRPAPFLAGIALNRTA